MGEPTKADDELSWLGEGPKWGPYKFPKFAIRMSC